MEKSDITTSPEAKEIEAGLPDSEGPHEEKFDPAQTKALVRKQDLRILPLCAGICECSRTDRLPNPWLTRYACLDLLCYLDRSNIGNAKVLNSETHNDLLQETNMTSYQFTIALMVFLVAYAVFEVPSNILLKKFSPSKWIAFLMFSWGALTIGLGGTQSYGSVTAVRFLLGTFEAGQYSRPARPRRD
jgi:hypothetical protein